MWWPRLLRYICSCCFVIPEKADREGVILAFEPVNTSCRRCCVNIVMDEELEKSTILME